MALAYHRKYRPKKLGEVIGQDENIIILKNAAAEDKLGQAYLFYGPRGTGKTTTARLVAKLLNCQIRLTDSKFRKIGEPCGQCVLCKSIDNLSCIDLIEIDAASNRGIDEMRNLKESIRTGPAIGRYKIYIIDEAHMLTREAANALLKTLEEPPPHAVIILATTEYEKLPATITSRTQRFIFKKISKTIILSKLNEIVTSENIPIEPEALELIAALADGSLRDAESLLDQMSSFSLATAPKQQNKITLELIESLTGRVSFRRVHSLAELIFKNRLVDALDELNKLLEEGHDLIRFTSDLIHYLRKALSLKTSPRLESMFMSEMTEDELKKLKMLSAQVNPENCILLIRSLIRAYADMRYSPFAIIPLELSLTEHLKAE